MSTMERIVEAIVEDIRRMNDEHDKIEARQENHGWIEGAKPGHHWHKYGSEDCPYCECYPWRWDNE